MEVLELFGGIGACTAALKRLDIDFHIADYVEIDKFAVKSYNAINGTNFEPQDITKWDKNITADLVMHGSPCQDLSIAGQGRGGDENSGTRSSLMYETLRIVGQINPKYVIWENVKNVLSKKHHHNFEKYIAKIDAMGFKSYVEVLDAKDYGVPQHRERVFVVSIRKDVDHGFSFPQPTELTKCLKDMLCESVDEKYYINAHTINQYNAHKARHEAQGHGLGWNPTNGNGVAFTITTRADRPNSNWIIEPRCAKDGELSGGAYDKTFEQACRVYSTSGLAPTLHTCQGGGQEPKIKDGDRVRKLTPNECWRLMGFTDEAFKMAEATNSNSQLYKQAGNSIVIPVLQGILASLFSEQEQSERVGEQLRWF